jgi:hypothetical protein
MLRRPCRFLTDALAHLIGDVVPDTIGPFVFVEFFSKLVWCRYPRGVGAERGNHPRRCTTQDGRSNENSP